MGGGVPNSDASEEGVDSDGEYEVGDSELPLAPCAKRLFGRLYICGDSDVNAQNVLKVEVQGFLLGADWGRGFGIGGAFLGMPFAFLSCSLVASLTILFISSLRVYLSWAFAWPLHASRSVL